jgi:hypothetical protein
VPNNDSKRDDNHWNNNGNNRNDNNRNDVNSPRHYDRAEQVRERLNRDNNVDDRPLRNDVNAGQNNNINTSGIRGIQSQPHNQQQATGDNNLQPGNRSNEGEPIRPLMQHRQTEGAIDVNSNNRINQERRVITDGADRRPNFSAPVQRTQEQNTNLGNPQPTAERQERQAEFSPTRNETEARAQPQQRTERANNNPRFSREKKDDDKK